LQFAHHRIASAHRSESRAVDIKRQDARDLLAHHAWIRVPEHFTDHGLVGLTNTRPNSVPSALHREGEVKVAGVLRSFVGGWSKALEEPGAGLEREGALRDEVEARHLEISLVIDRVVWFRSAT
jgi:hypothetical protein